MGTTNDITKTQKNPCKIWFGVAIPAAGAHILLGADGVPDAATNPLAKLVGLSDKGATLSITKTFIDEFYDEYKQPLERYLDAVGMTIKVDAAQVLDYDLLSLATVGAGSPTTISAKPVISIGEGLLAYTGIVVIAPTKSDKTKFMVFHIYKGFNTASVDIEVSRQTRAKISLELAGVAIASRAAEDTMGMLIPSY